jgi:hypothetical protein
MNEKRERKERSKEKDIETDRGREPNKQTDVDEYAHRERIER